MSCPVSECLCVCVCVCVSVCVCVCEIVVHYVMRTLMHFSLSLTGPTPLSIHPHNVLSHVSRKLETFLLLQIAP